MPTFQHLRSRGRAFKWLCWAMGILALTIAVIRWSLPYPHHLLPPNWVAPSIKIQEVSIRFRFYGFLIEMIPLSAQFAVLYSLYRIAQIYEAGEILTFEISTSIHRLGTGLIFLALAGATYTTAIIALLEYAATAQSLKLSFSLSTSELYLLISGIVVRSLGRVIKHGEDLKRENSQFI